MADQPDAPRRYFADVLRGAMAEERMTQPQLAAAIGVSQARVSRWLNRRGLPSDVNVERIAEVLHRPPEALAKVVAEDRTMIFDDLDTRSAAERLHEIEGRLGRVERLLAQLLEATRKRPDNGRRSSRG